MDDTTDQFILELPISATRVARRSLVLAAVVCCGSLNCHAGEAEAVVIHDRVLDWLNQLNLWNEVEPSEAKILRTSLGALTAEEASRIVWHTEGLVVLAWALNRLEIPKHDEQIDPQVAAASVGFLSEDAEQLIGTVKLRSRLELEAYRELLYAIHSRLRDFARHRKPTDFTDWIDRTWIETLKIDASHLIVQDDLAISGKAISKAKDDCWQECELITRERHKAIIWLVEGRSSYSQTSANT